MFNTRALRASLIIDLMRTSYLEHPVKGAVHLPMAPLPVADLDHSEAGRMFKHARTHLEFRDATRDNARLMLYSFYPPSSSESREIVEHGPLPSSIWVDSYTEIARDDTYLFEVHLKDTKETHALWLAVNAETNETNQNAVFGAVMAEFRKVIRRKPSVREKCFANVIVRMLISAFVYGRSWDTGTG